MGDDNYKNDGKDKPAAEKRTLALAWLDSSSLEIRLRITCSSS